MLGQIHYQDVLPPGIIHWYSLNSKLSGGSRPGLGVVEKTEVYCLCQETNHDCLRPDTALTAIYQLGTC